MVFINDSKTTSEYVTSSAAKVRLVALKCRFGAPSATSYPAKLFISFLYIRREGKKEIGTGVADRGGFGEQLARGSTAFECRS
jgi:hypothetical protein